eukprot:682786-Alexandrium_andersonii.AAC.1
MPPARQKHVLGRSGGGAAAPPVRPLAPKAPVGGVQGAVAPPPRGNPGAAGSNFLIERPMGGKEELPTAR